MCYHHIDLTHNYRLIEHIPHALHLHPASICSCSSTCELVDDLYLHNSYNVVCMSRKHMGYRHYALSRHCHVDRHGYGGQ